MAYNLAIVGYGGMGSWHHRNIQDHVPGAVRRILLSSLQVSDESV